MSARKSVTIVDTNTANLASIKAAFGRLGHDLTLAQAPAAIQDAEYLILPGVGAFDSGLDAIDKYGLAESIRGHFFAGKPLLAICLGMQLLGRGSAESPERSGLGVIDAMATAFPPSVVSPQLGWNEVSATRGLVAESGYASFANSFSFKSVPSDWLVSWADHGGPFVAAVEQGRSLFCQFHPELSGAWGRRLLQAWLEGVKAGGVTAC